MSDLKKRGRDQPAAGPSATTQSIATTSSNAAAATRKEDAKDLARRRAAHFAHFAPDDAPNESNIHVGGNNARSLGMWSSARELANNREKAQAEREERIRGSMDEDQEGKVTIDWQPRDTSRGPIPRPTSIPSLFSLTLSCLVDFVDCIDSLEGLPDSIKAKLAVQVCKQRKLSSEIADLFVAGAPSEVSLPDCSQIDAAAMTLALGECLTPRLSSLSLGNCGRGFGDPQADLFSRVSFERLTSLDLSGAYRLTDQGLVKVLASCPNIEALSLAQSSRITGEEFLTRLPTLVPKLKSLNLTDCRGLNLDELIKALPQMKHIESLCLDGIHLVDDQVMEAAGKMHALARLCISYSQVSDEGIKTLASSCSGITSLKIDECLNITDEGLHSAALHWKGLRDLSIRRCIKLSDESISMVCSNGGLVSLNTSGVVNVGDKTMLALANRCIESLALLDVSFCRLISEEALGLVADSCHKLKRMQVFGCSQVEKKLLNGHSNEGLAIIGA